MQTKIVSLQQTSNQEAINGEKNSVHQSVEKILRQDVAWGAVNEFMHVKVDNYSEL